MISCHSARLVVDVQRPGPGRVRDGYTFSILKPTEAASPVMEWRREHGMSEANFYRWGSKFGLSMRRASVNLSKSETCFRSIFDSILSVMHFPADDSD